MYAKYTEYLKDLMDNPQTAEALEKALSDYPLYHNDKTYDLVPNRSELNQKLLNHYKYREIGFETVGRFLDELNITMCEIMPYYNELFKTVVIMADLESPFDNVDVMEEWEQETEGQTTNDSSMRAEGESTNSGTSSQSSEHSSTSEKLEKHIHTDTPQTSISIPEQRMDETMYATDVNWDREGITETGNNSSNSQTEDSTNTTQEQTSSVEGTTKSRTSHSYHKKGNQGVNTYAHDMNEFRTTIIHVVDQIINDERINELFMGVF